MKKSYLGIDTSNYMTSVCFIDKDRKILYEGKQLLLVEKGKNGLQQSEAVFQHIKNLPMLFKTNMDMGQYELCGITVSKSPRPEEGSYMPVFLAGLAVAETMASTFNLPIVYTTHQEGHIAAGLYSIPQSETITSSHFLAVHLSGGTSELLNIIRQPSGFKVEKIGGTKDLHAGQLIDRIGVMLGCPFPAGPCFEGMAKEAKEDFERIPTSVKEFSFNFSGAEAEAKRRLHRREAKENIARAIEHHIATSIEKALLNAIKNGFPKDILIVGGVAQNQYLRDHLLKKLEHRSVGGKLYFADKKYSGDNAFGVANIGLNQLAKNI